MGATRFRVQVMPHKSKPLARVSVVREGEGGPGAAWRWMLANAAHHEKTA